MLKPKRNVYDAQLNSESSECIMDDFITTSFDQDFFKNGSISDLTASPQAEKKVPTRRNSASPSSTLASAGISRSSTSARRSKSLSTKITELHQVRVLGGVKEYEKQNTFEAYKVLSASIVKDLKVISKLDKKDTLKELVLSTVDSQIILNEDCTDSKRNSVISGHEYDRISAGDLVACVSHQQCLIIFLKRANEFTKNTCVVFYAKNAAAAKVIVSQINLMLRKFTQSVNN